MPHASVSKITRAIERAGGRVESAGGQHLRVYGPKGMARIGIEINTPRMSRNLEAVLRKYAGLEVRISV